MVPLSVVSLKSDGRSPQHESNSLSNSSNDAGLLGTWQRPEGKLAEMKEGLGDSACSLVRINSGDKEKKSGLAGLWQSQIR